MIDFKSFIASKKIGWYVSIAACVLGLIALIAYTARGGHYLSPVSTAAVLMFVFGVVTNIAVLVKDFKLCAIVPVIFYSIALAILLNTEMQLITNVIFGVDGNVLDGGWWTFVITDVLAVIASAVAFGLGLEKPKTAAAA